MGSELEEFEMKMVSTFADRLMEAMAKRGVTNAKLSKLTGVPKSVITRYLNGHMKAKSDRLRLMAEKLNVNEAWLEGYNVGMDRVTIVNPYYKPNAKMTDVDKVLGYGLVRQVYESIKDLDDVQLKKVLAMIELIK